MAGFAKTIGTGGRLDLEVEANVSRLVFVRQLQHA